MSFASDVKKICDKKGLSLDRFGRGVKLKLFTGIIKRSRVDTGRFRGNWQTSTGEPKFTTVDRFDKIEKGKNGGAAFEEVSQNITGFGVDYLTNNLPYAKPLEEKDATVALEIERIDRNIREEIKRVSK